MREGIAILEITALGAALVILDQVEKAASIRLIQAELNDYYGFVLKITGDAGALQTAVKVAQEVAETLKAKCLSTVIEAPDARAWAGILSPVEYNPLIEQNIVYACADTVDAVDSGKVAGEQSNDSHGQRVTDKSNQSKTVTVIGNKSMNSPAPFAIGLIETQGFTAVIEAIDTACKAANVEVLGKEKLGGGYITILIKGDVAAVNAAVEAGKARVPELGKLIAAHVIPRPSEAVLKLLGVGVKS